MGLRCENMIPKWTSMAGPAVLQKDMGARNSRLSLACKDPRLAGAVYLGGWRDSIGMREIKAWIRNKVRRA